MLQTCDGIIPAPGSTCASVNPADFDKCCWQKRQNYEFDPSCKKPTPPAPLPGSSCASLPPKYQRKCCEEKEWKGIYDRACVRKPHYPDWEPEWRPRPRSCGRLPYHAAKKCCAAKIANCDYSDKACSIPQCKKYKKGSKQQCVAAPARGGLRLPLPRMHGRWGLPPRPIRCGPCPAPLPAALLPAHPLLPAPPRPGFFAGRSAAPRRRLLACGTRPARLPSPASPARSTKH